MNPQLDPGPLSESALANRFGQAWTQLRAHEDSRMQQLGVFGGPEACAGACDPNGGIDAEVVIHDEEGRQIPKFVTYTCCALEAGRCVRGRQVAGRHDQERAAAFAERLAAWGVPARLHDASFEAGRQTEALEAAHEFARTELTRQGALILAGPSGVGKSYAAVCVARTAATFGLRSSFLVSYRVPAVVKDDAAWERATAADFLVYDDAGNESRGRVAPWISDAVSRLFHERYEERRATVVTTNAGGDGLRKLLAPPVYERVRAWAGALTEVGGESMRGRTDERGDG